MPWLFIAYLGIAFGVLCARWQVTGWRFQVLLILSLAIGFFGGYCARGVGCL